MHVKDTKKREILEFKDFLKVINDPWNKKNFNKEVKNRSPFNQIKLEKPYEYVGYGDAIFNNQSKINYASKSPVEPGNAANMGTGDE